ESQTGGDRDACQKARQSGDQSARWPPARAAAVGPVPGPSSSPTAGLPDRSSGAEPDESVPAADRVVRDWGAHVPGRVGESGRVVLVAALPAWATASRSRTPADCPLRPAPAPADSRSSANWSDGW